MRSTGTRRIRITTCACNRSTTRATRSSSAARTTRRRTRTTRATRFRGLEEWTRARFTSAGERIAQWSGQVLETNDYLAFIGKNPDGAEHVWLATGDSGMGMTHGTIAGLLLPTLLDGRAHPWAKEFDPKRVTLHGRELGTLAKENADVALQFGDYVTPGQVDDVASIPPGEGRVIRRGAHKIAVYKDDAGRVHERSAACTHVQLHRGLEHGREELGLSLPRIALRSVRQGAQRAGDRRPPPSAVASHTSRSRQYVLRSRKCGSWSRYASRDSSRAASSDGM